MLYEQLVELIIRVADYILRAEDALRRKVRRAMGGEVLELMRERAERLEREAEARGIERGEKIGIENGIEEGIEQGRNDLADKLRGLGVDEALLRKALEE